MDQDAGLDGRDGVAVVHRIGRRPGPAAVVGTLEVDTPAVMLRAGPREDGAVREDDGLVLHRAEDAIRKAFGLRPGAASVLGEDAHPPPFARVRPHLVEEHQRFARRLEEHRVPGREPCAVRLGSVGDGPRGAPASAFVPRYVDGHFRMALVLPREPRGDQPLRRFDDGRGVDLWGGRILEDEPGGEDGLGVGGGGEEEERDQEREGLHGVGGGGWQAGPRRRRRGRGDAAQGIDGKVVRRMEEVERVVAPRFR